MRLITIFLLLLTVHPLFSQEIEDCRGDCPCMIRQAETMVEIQRYDQAIRLYNAAKVCAPGQGTEIDNRILNIFKLIQQQRDEAVAARREATKQEQAAIKARREAEAALYASSRLARSNSNALTALQLAKTNPTKALRMAEMNYHLFPESETAVGIFREIFANQEQGSTFFQKKP